MVPLKLLIDSSDRLIISTVAMTSISPNAREGGPDRCHRDRRLVVSSSAIDQE